MLQLHLYHLLWNMKCEIVIEDSFTVHCKYNLRSVNIAISHLVNLWNAILHFPTLALLQTRE